MKVKEIKDRIKNYKKDYVQRHLCGGEYGIKLKCDCCQESTNSLEHFYHKSEDVKTIGLCVFCVLRWRGIKFRYKYKKTIEYV